MACGGGPDPAHGYIHGETTHTMNATEAPAPPDVRTAPAWLTYLLLGLLLVVVALFGTLVIRGYLHPRPETLLARVFDTYQGATTYYAVGTVIIEGKVAGSEVEQQMPSSLAYEAPNRLASSQGEGTSATRTICDGETIYIELPAFGRVIKAPAPESLRAFSNLGPEMGNAAAHTVAAGDRLPDLTALIDGSLTRDDVVAVRGGIDSTDAWYASLDTPTGARALTMQLRAGPPVVLWIDPSEYKVRQMAVRISGTDMLSMAQDGAEHDDRTAAMLREASLGMLVRCDTVLINEPLPDGIFDYVVPAGLRLVEADSPEQMSSALMNDYAAIGDGAVPPARAGALMGRTMPDIQARDLSGKAVPISRFKGGPFILDFWATWHPNAATKLDTFGQLRHALGGAKIPVVAISIDTSPEPVRDLVKKTSPDCTVLWLDPRSKPAQQLDSDYGLLRMPHTLYVDADFTVIHAVDGVEPKDHMLERLARMGVNASPAR